MNTAQPLNIVVPMAGRGSRFAEAGYTVPKPLIPIHGRAMIDVVIANLRPAGSHRFIFICQRAHLESWNLAARLEAMAPGCSILALDGITEGAACTVLTARELIDTDAPLMIANCDQWVDFDMGRYLQAQDEGRLDGLIMTMRADDPKWSYARIGPDGLVTEVVEKQVVSNQATTGIYSYRHGRHFVAAAAAMIADDERVNGEFYVAPAYNRMIAEGGRVGWYDVGGVGAGMYGLGTPEDLERFLAMDISRRAADAARPATADPLPA